MKCCVGLYTFELGCLVNKKNIYITPLYAINSAPFRSIFNDDGDWAIYGWGEDNDDDEDDDVLAPLMIKLLWTM